MEGRRGGTNKRHAGVDVNITEFSSSQKIEFNADVVQRFFTINKHPPHIDKQAPHIDKLKALIDLVGGVGVMNTHLIDTKNSAFVPVVVYSLYCSRVYRFEDLLIRSPPCSNALMSDCLSFRRVGPVVVWCSGGVWGP